MTKVFPVSFFSASGTNISFSLGSSPEPSDGAPYDGRQFSFIVQDNLDHTSVLHGKLIKRDGQWGFDYTSSSP